MIRRGAVERYKKVWAAPKKMLRISNEKRKRWRVNQLNYIERESAQAIPLLLISLWRQAMPVWGPRSVSSLKLAEGGDAI